MDYIIKVGTKESLSSICKKIDSLFTSLDYIIHDRKIFGQKVRNFVIEGVACQPPSSLRRLQVTPPLQTSLPESDDDSDDVP